MTLKLESNIPGRDDIVDQSYVDNDENIAGKGGTENKYWKRKSSNTDAGWDSIQASEVGGLSPVATSGAYSDLSGAPTIPEGFKLGDVATELTSVADDDRFLLWDTSATGENKNRYSQGSTLKTYFQSQGISAGDIETLYTKTNLTSTWEDCVSATKYQEMTDNSVLLISAVDLSDQGKTDTVALQRSQITSTARWFVAWGTGPSGKRIQLRTSGTGDSTKIQINKESSLASSNQVRVYWIKGQKGDTGQPGTDGTDGMTRYFIYKKRLATAALPTAPTGGTFSGGNLVPPTDWSLAVPSYSPTTEVVDVSQRTARDTTWTDSAWSTPAQFTGTRGVQGTKGDKGDPGQQGNPGGKGDKGDPGDAGTHGAGYVAAYKKRAATDSAPSAPTGGSVSGGVLTAPTNWSNVVPSYDPLTDVVDISTRAVSGNTLQGSWSTPRQFTGSRGAVGPSADVTLANLPEIKDGYLYKGKGTGNSVEEAPVFDTTETGTYDSGSQSDSAGVSVTDTDAIVMPAVNSPGLIVSENITGFGTVYKTEATFTSLPITISGTFDTGVALRLRKVTTKPTASSDAKTLGTQVGSDGTGSGNQRTVAVTETNVAPDTYYFYALSGGGTRTISARSVRFGANATWSRAVTGIIDDDDIGDKAFSNPPSDLTSTEKTAVRTAINAGGSAIATQSAKGQMSSADKTKLDGVATGAEVNVQSDWNASSGDAQILNKPTIPSATPDASETVKGKVELATNAETQTGTDSTRAVTPAGLASAFPEFTVSSTAPASPSDGDYWYDTGTGKDFLKVRVSGGWKRASSFTAADESKLDGIATGAEVNVQSDWNASSGDAQILNKPTIPSATPDASETVKGKVERATNTEAETGTDTTRFVTPYQLKTYGGSGGGSFDTSSIDGQTEATSTDGDLTLVSTAHKQTSAPTYDSGADYSDSNDFQGLCSFNYGGTEYVLGFKASSRSMYVKKGSAAFVEKTNALQSANNNVKGADVVISGSTISLITTQASSSSAYVYTFNVSNDTLTFVATRALDSTNNNPQGLAIVLDGSTYNLWIGQQGSNKIFVYDTNATLSTVTYQSSKSFTSAAYHNHLLEAVGSVVYIVNQGASSVKAYNPNRTANTAYDFTRNSNNTTAAAMYADSRHIYINDTTDNKFYAYSWKTAVLRKKQVRQGALEGGGSASDLSEGNIPIARNTRMANNNVIVGTGTGSDPVSKPLFDGAGSTETLAYDSGTQSASDSAGTSDPMDMGAGDGTVVTRETLGNGFVYKINRGFTGNLRVRADSSFNTGVAFVCRYASTKPSTTNLTTHGTQLFSQGTTNNSASGDANIPQASAVNGAYFWFYPSATRDCTNRRLRLDGSYTEPQIGVIPPASETTSGIVERATDSEASTGTDTTRYVTPKHLKDNAGGFDIIVQATVSADSQNYVDVSNHSYDSDDILFISATRSRFTTSGFIKFGDIVTSDSHFLNGNPYVYLLRGHSNNRLMIKSSSGATASIDIIVMKML